LHAASRAESSLRIFHASQALVVVAQKINLFAVIIIASPQENTYVYTSDGLEELLAMTDNSSSNDLLALTTEIVAAHVSNNTVAVGDLPQLINQVYQSLSSIGKVPVPTAERPQPAVSVKRSVHPDYIICLEDGKKLKMLKRHLKTAYDMTPDEYRERWSLPPDYPMVAPNYARQRSKLAKEIGLGTRGRRTNAA
jgi:predicted transcriptional regulator